MQIQWIFEEVLPSIRKHGAYMTEQTIEVLTSPDFIIRLATQLKEEKEKRTLVEKQIAQQAPLVGFAETCMASKDSILIRELAKVASNHNISIGEKRLYRKLREWGLIMQHKTEPYQQAIDQGLFEVVQGVRETSRGNLMFQTTRVTTKGQVYIIERLKKEFAIAKAIMTVAK